MRKFLIGLLLFSSLFSCKNDDSKNSDPNSPSNQVENKSLIQKDDKGIEYCNCKMLAIDNKYNHFYLEDRTKPYTGICREYHPNGKLMREVQMVAGKNNGHYKVYSDKGILLEDGNFRNNLHHGEYRYYNEEGKLVYEAVYEDGLSKDFIPDPTQ
jgi:antitoxin component YwqK of YwqJK toxin-antitoxin module